MTFTPDMRLLQDPIGPLRDKYSHAVVAADFVLEKGFICQAGAAGDITYRTLNGIADQTETVAAGGTISVGGVPVILQAVRGSGDTTVASLVIGIL